MTIKSRKSDDDCEHFRSYLAMLARVSTDPRLAGKLDASEIVQQTPPEFALFCKKGDFQ